MNCDFCNAPNAVWDYPAKSFRISVNHLNIVWGSDGGWAACHTCHSLIQSGNAAALLARSEAAMTFPRGFYPDVDEAIDDARRRLHATFHASRLGPPRPIAWA